MTATAPPIPHAVNVVNDRPGWVRRECVECGWAGKPWNPKEAPGIQMTGGRCPEDRTVTALVTLQFASGGLFDPRPVDAYACHLVRSTPNGTPGPTLCGLDRFAKAGAGWSLRGGVSGPGITHEPCPGCRDAARAEFPGLPVSGLGGAKMAAELGVGWKR